MTHELEELERQGWQALSGPEGAAFYENLMAEDGLMVFPGLVLDKNATIRAIAGERPWTWFELSAIQVISLTPDASLITYRATSQREGEAEYRALMTSVYAKREGGWRLVLHQQTPLPGGS
jgi:uncharacterized protein (TIGR02246 family)